MRRYTALQNTVLRSGQQLARRSQDPESSSQEASGRDGEWAHRRICAPGGAYRHGRLDEFSRRFLRQGERIGLMRCRRLAHSPTLFLAPDFSLNSLNSLYSLYSPPAVLLPQILNPIFCLRRFAGSAGHEIVGQITAAVPVDLRPDPI